MVDTDLLVVRASLDQVVRLSMYRGDSSDIRIYHDEWGTATIRDALDALRFDAPRHYALVEAYTRMVAPSSDGYDRCFPERKITHLADRTLDDGIVSCAIALTHEAGHSMLHHLRVPCSEQEDSCIKTEGDCLLELGKEYWEMLGIGYMYPNIEAYLGLRKMNQEMERQEIDN